eukprot:943369-Pyramimonas_sp.AAC.1
MGCTCKLSAAAQAASSSAPNDDLRASLCDRRTASSKWHASLPARRHLPKRVHAASLMPYP